MWACPACTYEQADSRKQCKLCLTMRPDLVALQKQLYAEPVKPKAKGKAKASCDSVRGGRPTQNVAKARSPKRPLPAASHVASAHMQHLQSKRPAASASAWFDDEGGAPPCILEAVAVEPEPVESDEDSSSDLTSDDAVLTYELQLPALKSKAVGKAAREERRIGTSVGYGVALYPTAGISLKANLLLRPPAVTPSSRPNPVPIGVMHQAEIPEAPKAWPTVDRPMSVDRGDVLVIDPLGAAHHKSEVSLRANARELADHRAACARQLEKTKARAQKKASKGEGKRVAPITVHA